VREFIRAHGERIGDISIYGQKLDDTTWRLVKVNLAIRRIKDRTERGDSFFADCFPDLIVAHSKASRSPATGRSNPGNRFVVPRVH
jgi:type I restriction enzyme M protein